MKIPGLGEVHMESEFGWYRSEPMPLKLLNGRECSIYVAGYDRDNNQQDYHEAIANLLANSFDSLRKAESFIFKYYQDVNSYWSPEDPEFIEIAAPEHVWKHVQLGHEPMVSRRGYGDKGIYVSFECGCDWEPEHGLQIVLKNGQNVVKVGPYDGHLTNSDAFDDESLEHVIYREA